MSRRIQCNTLSVKAKPDGTCGNIECETLHCKKLVCEENNTQSTLSKSVNIPHNLNICTIGLGMIGTSDKDTTVQYSKSFVDFDSLKLMFIWNDWNSNLEEQCLHYRLNDGEWESVKLKSNITIVDHCSHISKDNEMKIEVYSQSCDDYDIQSLCIQLHGDYIVQIGN